MLCQKRCVLYVWIVFDVFFAKCCRYEDVYWQLKTGQIAPENSGQAVVLLKRAEHKFLSHRKASTHSSSNHAKADTCHCSTCLQVPSQCAFDYCLHHGQPELRAARRREQYRPGKIKVPVGSRAFRTTHNIRLNRVHRGNISTHEGQHPPSYSHLHR